MSGFALLFDFASASSEAHETFDSFRQAVAHFKCLDSGYSTMVEPQALAIRFNSPSSLHREITIDEQTGSWLFAVGTLVMNDQNNPPDGNLDSLLDRYLKEGEALFQNLDGTFTLIIYDKPAQKLLVVADPLGFSSVFYARDKNKLYLASSSLAIAKTIQASPSEYGAYLFLTTGGVYGKTTLWQDIERLSAGTLLEITSSGVTEKVYWKPAINEDIAKLSLTETVDYVINLLSTINKHHLSRESQTWADLTGGFDSRLTTMMLDYSGLPFEACCQGPKASPDVRISSDIAQSMGWAYQHNILPDNWGKERYNRFEYALGKGDAHLDVFKLSSVLWDQDQRRQNYPVSVWGLGGELWRGFFWRQEFLNVGRTPTVNYNRLLDYRIMHPVDSAVFRDEKSVSETYEKLKTLLQSVGEQYVDLPNTFKLDCIYAYKNTAHAGAHISAVMGLQRVINPLFLKESMTCAISTNFRWRNHSRLVRLLIEKTNPVLADIPTTSGGPARPMRLTNLHKFKPYWTVIAKQLIRKSSRSLLGRNILSASPDEFSTYPIVQWRKDTLNYIEQDKLLSPEYMHSGALYNPQTLADFVSRAYTPQFEQETFLSRIITVELALRAIGKSF